MCAMPLENLNSISQAFALAFGTIHLFVPRFSGCASMNCHTELFFLEGHVDIGSLSLQP